MGIRIGISLVVITITIIIHALGTAFWISYQAKHFSTTMDDWRWTRILRILIVFAIFIS